MLGEIGLGLVGPGSVSSVSGSGAGMTSDALFFRDPSHSKELIAYVGLIVIDAAQ